MNIHRYICYILYIYYVCCSEGGVCYSADNENMRWAFIQFKDSLQKNFHAIKISQHMQDILRKFSCYSGGLTEYV